eukprot:g2383.t1
MRLIVLILALNVVESATPCSFVPGCDYGHGSRDSAPASSKESCCAQCQAKANCAAGVLSGGLCWFKTAAEVSAGCQKSSKVDFACLATSVPTPAPPPSCASSACQALEAKYSSQLNATCKTVAAHVPTPDAGDLAAFMALYQNYTAASGQDEAPVISAATKVLQSAKVAEFLSLPDSFGEGGLDTSMVLCALLTEATPTALAEFAYVDPANEAQVAKLLADPVLMRDMLVAGGATFSETDKGNKGPRRYGEAMAIYEKILKASDHLPSTMMLGADPSTLWDDRAQENVMKRFALGTALEHAVPIHLHYSQKDCDEAYDWCPAPPADANETMVDPVARYLHYEKAYLAGDLDPAFEVLTAFEAKHVCNSPASDADLDWVRQSMRIYRPDYIAMGYEWRYAEAVRGEVAYGDPMCAKWAPEVCSGHYASIPAADGVCGPRAFFGRFTRLAFGIPTWGATQPGHAAMTTWSPDGGWHTLLGAGWPSCWWGVRSGPDFYLEGQARENRADFQRVLRGQWVGLALGEEPAGSNWGKEGGNGYGIGGPWSALMLYAKKISVASGPAAPRAVGKSIVPTKVEALLAKWPTQVPTPKVTTRADGTIEVPAVAFTSKNKSASLTVMKSAGAISAGEQLLHGGCASPVGPPCLEPLSSMFEYALTDVPAAGTYWLTANFTTWHMDQDLSVSVNGADTVPVPVFYSVGWWNETQPLEVSLRQGANTLSFQRSSTRPIVLKSFLLYKAKPAVQAPIAAYTPSPTPPYPNASQYIEVAAATTCVKQGILPVPAEDCDRACYALGFKGTGPRARPNISGCFVMTDGPYAGNCNYNTNTSATCDPPCTLYGAAVQSLCLR